MSIFDSPETSIQEFDLRLQLLSDCLRPGPLILQTDNPEAVIDILLEIIGGARPVVRWDVRSFRKKDAIGSMYALSRLPKDPRPVVLIENIANIPVGSPDVYDDPVHVENVLLHSWKNEVINLTHWREGAFQIVSRDYTIIIIVSSGDLQKTHYSVAGEIGIVTIPG